MLKWKFGSKATPPKPVRVHIAAYGDTFRTCTFAQPGVPLLGTFFLQANKQDDGTWEIYRVSERPDSFGDAATDNDLVVQQEKIKTESNYFDALTHLARFESTALDKGYEAIDLQEKEALGFGHYQAFARREGFIFDKISGNPVLAKNGKIEGAGTFSKTELALFQQQNRPFEIIAKMANDNLLLAATAKEFLKNPTDEVVNLTKKKIFFDRFVAALENVRRARIEVRQDCLKGDTIFHGKMALSYESMNQTFESIDFSNNLFSQEIFVRGMKIIRLFNEIEAVQMCLHGFRDTDSFQKRLNEVYERLESLDLPKNFADAVILSPPDLYSELLAPPAEEFIAYCRDIQRTIGSTFEAAIGNQVVSTQSELPSPAKMIFLDPPKPQPM